ncbi:MAG: hypothetical protein QT03_C0001G1055 [archaeon GW2011_AR10]|uniref:CoA-binding protein n=1 Tax=Candidatus Iainarchaeum sp. TaxID=3101447 RepID=A0A7J4IRF6_9ARCH|nr:MAG: hypothetical protein QT03_C0001G1055 [archaeon GW2011_AR10]HIH08078.1 CoA-binding protein [Candidatus Diapherotrites archaeon]
MQKTIAVIGASADRQKFGNKAVRAYKEKGWKVFPVNLKEKEIEGLKCYASILDLPGKPDRVSVYLPPTVTLSLIPELRKAKVKEVILNPGAESDELIAALKKKGIKPIMICSIRAIGVDPDAM